MNRGQLKEDAGKFNGPGECFIHAETVTGQSEILIAGDCPALVLTIARIAARMAKLSHYKAADILDGAKEMLSITGKHIDINPGCFEVNVETSEEYKRWLDSERKDVQMEFDKKEQQYKKEIAVLRENLVGAERIVKLMRDDADKKKSYAESRYKAYEKELKEKEAEIRRLLKVIERNCS